MIDKIFVICEGSTEEQFVKHLLQPQFDFYNVKITPTIIGEGKNRGGNVTYNRILSKIKHLLYNMTPNCIVTTFIDFYGLNEEFPGKKESLQIIDIEAKFNNFIKIFRNKLEIDFNITAKRIIPYIQMYEFEALLFSDSKILSSHIKTKEKNILDILKKFNNVPETINNSVNTAPSKRIENLCKDFIYKKNLHGILIANDIGYQKIVDKCFLFANWMQDIKSRIQSENTKLQHQEIL
jgi:hypothetical protein